MSNYIRVPDVEDSFNALHGIKPQIYQKRISGVEVDTKLIFGNKEIMLTEVMEKALTKDSLLFYNGEVKRFDSVFKAEQEAVKILRS